MEKGVSEFFETTASSSSLERSGRGNCRIDGTLAAAELTLVVFEACLRPGEML